MLEDISKCYSEVVIQHGREVIESAFQFECHALEFPGILKIGVLT